MLDSLTDASVPWDCVVSILTIVNKIILRKNVTLVVLPKESRAWRNERARLSATDVAAFLNAANQRRSKCTC
jgi:hypothetical protein